MLGFVFALLTMMNRLLRTFAALTGPPGPGEDDELSPCSDFCFSCIFGGSEPRSSGRSAK